MQHEKEGKELERERKWHWRLMREVGQKSEEGLKGHCTIQKTTDKKKKAETTRERDTDKETPALNE